MTAESERPVSTHSLGLSPCNQPTNQKVKYESESFVLGQNRRNATAVLNGVFHCVKRQAFSRRRKVFSDWLLHRHAEKISNEQQEKDKIAGFWYMYYMCKEQSKTDAQRAG